MGRWNHVVVTYQGSLAQASRFTIYVDGVDATNRSDLLSAGTITDIAPTDINLGANSGDSTEFYDGQIDDLRLYNYALTPDEVKVEYNQGKSIVLGSLSTDPNGVTASNSAARAYCPPGDTATCNPPVGHWTLDERTGTTANDTSGKSNNGTLTNGPEWITGKVGQALQLDGVNDYVNIDVSNEPAIPIRANAAHTISLWVKGGRQANQQAYAEFTDDNTAFAIEPDISGNTGKVAIWLRVNNTTLIDDTTSNSVGVAFDNAWHHIVWTDTSGTAKLYIDGVLDATNYNYTYQAGTWDAVYLGTQNPLGANRFNGSLDDVRIYNYVRTPAQIAWDYNRGGPVGWWKFDECTGTTAYDASGQGQNGTITIAGTGSQSTAGNCATTDTTAARYNGREGKYNSSLNLDGTDDYVNVADNNIFSFTDGSGNDRPYSLSAWVYMRDITSTQGVVTKWQFSGNNMEWVLYTANSELLIENYHFNNDNFLIGRKLTLGAAHQSRWMHVVATYDGSETTGSFMIYIDAVRSDTMNSSFGAYTGMSNTAGAVQIAGYDGGSNNLDAIIDDVRIYNYALTTAQIRTLYNENAAVRFGPLTGSP